MIVDTIIANDYCLRMSTEQPKPAPKTPTDLPRVTSEDLLGEKRELVIVHKGREYRLRLTQNDKLILTA